MKVMFYVQHLLGIGHLVRASRVASALAAQGDETVMVSGGLPVAGFPPENVRCMQLPPLRSVDEAFSGLADASGKPVAEAFLTERKAALMQAFQEIAPDVLIIEAFPFARRQMRFELMPLLDRIKAMPAGERPFLVSSIRDLLQPKSLQRDEATADLVNDYFNLVMVHADESFATLGETFSAADRIADKVVYTGMVGPSGEARKDDRQFDVVVSAGGGAVGGKLLAAAIQASASDALSSMSWLCLTGPNLQDTAFARLRAQAGSNVEVARFEPALAALLKHARVSISQAGYNTVADILAAGCASVLVPFAERGEKEQALRAGKLASRNRAVVLPDEDLSAHSLCKAIDEALAMAAKHRPSDGGHDGARRSAELVASRFAQHKRELRGG